MSTYQMYGDRILCKRIGSSRETQAGVIKTSASKEKPLHVEVVSSGVTDIVVGDILLIARYSGMEVEIEGDTLIIIDTNDVLATVKDYK